MPDEDTTAMPPEGAGAGKPLMERLYDELLALAREKMRRERPEHILQPTALVHEAYLRLAERDQDAWQGRTHFFAVAAQAMQRVLVDQARARDREKRGGGWRRVDLNDAFSLGPEHRLDMIALDEALEKMARLDERQARIVKLKLFGGLSAEEIAELMDVGARTVERDWTMGRAWLRRELRRGE